MNAEKFKDSPLGPIPQDWEVKRLGDVVTLVTKGTTPTSIGCEFTHSGVKFLKAESIADNGSLIPSMFAYISEQTHELLRRSQLKENDILFSIAGVLGRVGIVSKEVLPANTNQALAIIRPNIDGEVDIKFLFYCLHAEYITEAINQLQVGVAQANLSLENVEGLRLALPPLSEQQRIAEALGEVDKLIESLDEQIEKKRLIARGVAHDLLSGKKRLPGFKGEWREVAFKAAFISLGNNTYARECLCGDSANAYDIHYGDVLIRFGAVVDFSSDYIPRLKDGIKPNKDFLQDGDIVFADTAEDEMVGKAVEILGLGDDKAVSGLHTMACRPRADMFAPRFLGYYLNSDSYRKQLLPLITGSKVSSLSRANFESTTLTMPDVSEQQAIADLLSEQDAAIAALEAKREKYARIKEGMMRDLLTGKVRMKGE